MATYIQQKMMELRYGGPSMQGGAPPAQMPPLEPISQGLQPTAIAAPALRPEPEPMIVPLEHHHLNPQVITQAPAKVRQLVGAAALHGTPWSHVNPYTKTSFMMRKQFSRFS